MFGFLTTPTALYIDPTSVSILLTSISGVIIAISATAVIYWRKAKKKVANVLHIDENANKDVEEDIVINESVEQEATEAETVSADKE